MKKIKVSNLTTSKTITRHFTDTFFQTLFPYRFIVFRVHVTTRTLSENSCWRDKKYRKCLITHDASNKLHDINDHLETQQWHFHLNFVACSNGFTVLLVYVILRLFCFCYETKRWQFYSNCVASCNGWTAFLVDI